MFQLPLNGGGVDSFPETCLLDEETGTRPPVRRLHHLPVDVILRGRGPQGHHDEPTVVLVEPADALRQRLHAANDEEAVPRLAILHGLLHGLANPVEALVSGVLRLDGDFQVRPVGQRDDEVALLAPMDEADLLRGAFKLVPERARDPTEEGLAQVLELVVVIRLLREIYPETRSWLEAIKRPGVS